MSDEGCGRRGINAIIILAAGRGISYIYRSVMYLKKILLPLFVALVACGGDDGPRPGEPTKVVLWEFGGVPGLRDWVQQAVEDFNAERSDIYIELEFRDWATQRESLISTTIVGDGPDIVRVHHKYSVEFGELGGLYPLDNFADFPQVKERILDNVWELVEYDGQHYGLPVTMLPFVLAVNTKIMAEKGLAVPETWEEMLALGPEFKGTGVELFTIPGGVNLDTAYRFLPLLYKAGGRVFNDDWLAAAFNGPAGLAALEFLIAMKTKGYLPPGSAAYAFDENAAHWATGRAALSIEGPWWQDIVHGNYGFDLENLALAQIPKPAEHIGPHESRTLLDVIMISITGYTKVPDEAWEVVKALNLNHPVWLQPNPSMGGIPTLKAAYAEGVQSDYINLDQLAKAGANGLGWPGHPAVTQVQRYIADAVNMALTGTMSPKEALDFAAEEVNEVLSDY
jgi:multiple sugar transport system substrate-binding protein